MNDDGMAEAIATAGLFLLFAAVIAVVVCLASWGAADGPFAAAAGAVAVVSFAGSVACFSAQADELAEPAPQELTVG